MQCPEWSTESRWAGVLGRRHRVTGKKGRRGAVWGSVWFCFSARFVCLEILWIDSNVSSAGCAYSEEIVPPQLSLLPSQDTSKPNPQENKAPPLKESIHMWGRGGEEGTGARPQVTFMPATRDHSARESARLHAQRCKEAKVHESLTGGASFGILQLRTQQPPNPA